MRSFGRDLTNVAEERPELEEPLKQEDAKPDHLEQPTILDVKQEHVESHLIEQLTADIPPPQKNGWFSTTLLLASSGMGSGMLALPYAVKTAGSPYTALAILLTGFVLSSFSTAVILIGASRLNASTYGLLVDQALGFKLTAFKVPLVDAIFFIYLLLINISFLVFLGDFIPSLARSVGLGWDVRTLTIVTCAMGFIGPLTMFNSMGFVRHIAGCGILAVFFTTAVTFMCRIGASNAALNTVHSQSQVVVYKSVDLIPKQGTVVSEAWSTAPTVTVDSLGSAGIFIFAFCIGSHVPAIACEMEAPSARRAVSAAVVSTSIMLIAYSAIGLLGYFSFANSSNFESNFIKNYPDTDGLMMTCRALLSITILSVSVLNFVPTMKSLYECLTPFPRWADLPERPIARGVVTLTLAAFSALVAVEVHDIGVLIEWLGSMLGAPELMLAPVLLFSRGHVAAFSARQVHLLVFVVALLFIFLWTAAIANNIVGA